MTQTSIFDILHAPAVLPPYPCGWHRCPCDVVFWQGGEKIPNLHPFRFWTCWRHIRRASPIRLDVMRDEGWRP